MSESKSENTEEKMEGFIALKLQEGKTINEFCEQYFNNYDPDQFDPIVIRFYFGKETIMTLYALNKVRQEGTNFDKNKLPVKKFKSTVIDFAKILPYIGELNFTLSTGSYPLEDMEVINK